MVYFMSLSMQILPSLFRCKHEFDFHGSFEITSLSPTIYLSFALVALHLSLLRTISVQFDGVEPLLLFKFPDYDNGP